MCVGEWPRVSTISVFLFLLASAEAVFLEQSQSASEMAHSHKTIWKPICEKVNFHSLMHMSPYHNYLKNKRETLPDKYTGHQEEDVALLKTALAYIGADFFNDSEVQEMADGAKELNLPAFEMNRRLVASEDGGLHDPSVLVFNAGWNKNQCHNRSGKFSYPVLSEVKKPKDEDNIAFMSVIELASLIRTKQITSQELTNVFLRRLKRYNHLLESVISITEDLASSQAKNADDLLNEGI